MTRPMVIQSQLLATKFFVPVAPGTLISRPRLSTLLDESLKHPLTLISAPAGFGKTMLLSTWAQSLPASHALVAWLSLDEEDNDPQLFWTYVLSALDQRQPERFTSLFKSLQSPQAPPLKQILTALSNLLLESPEHMVLILDDYHLITDQQVHVTLSYLVEHPPPQLHIILATRTDPPFSLSSLRACQQMLEVRADQLRCTAEETKTFLKEVMNTHLPDRLVQEVTTRTEGWLVGLQLLGLSLPDRVHPEQLLQEMSGDQRYILDYLTEVVLQQQPPEVQTFLLSTCILERLTAPLCEAVLQQTGSQHLLQRLEQANLFVVSLDSKREWYRYHALFAEALHYQLEQTQPDLMLTLHHRASLWYAKHSQSTQAILHAVHAKAWDVVADLIERMWPQLSGLAWGISLRQLSVLHQCLKRLPPEIVGSRPLLCLACTKLLWTVASYPMLQAWLSTAETRLTASLTAHMSEVLAPEEQQEQRNLLGSVIGFRAVLQSYQEHAEAALPLCQQVLSLVSADHVEARIQVAIAQVWAYDYSVANDASAAVESGLQAVALAQATGEPTLIIGMMGVLVTKLLGMGKLNEVQQLAQQAMQVGKQPGGRELPHVSLPAFYQAEVLRERNHLDAALSLIKEAIFLSEQVESYAALASIFHGYAVLLRVYLSRGELDAAYTAFRKLEDLGTSIEPSLYLQMSADFAVIDQVRLWLACGERDRATRWAQELDLKEPHGSLFVRARQEEARVRVLLATDQPTLALQRLEPVLQRATTGLRWGHVIEIQLLQALAYHILQQEAQALATLSEAIRLAEPEGYIRSFVDEGVPMAVLLFRLREQQHKAGPTPYLDTLLAAFQERSKAQKRLSKRRRQESG